LPISLVVVFFIAIFVKDCLNAKYNNLTGWFYLNRYSG
jgi:hypothetical protein